MSLQSGDGRRTAWSMGTSVVVHAIVLLLLLLIRPHDPAAGTMLAEIEYVGAEPPMAVAAAVEEPVQVALARPAETRERFRRAASEAEVAPVPQSDLALADRITARLESLRDRNDATAVVSAATPVPSRWSAATAGAPVPSRGAPVDLRREGAERAPLSLDRGAPVRASLDPAVVATRPREPEPPAAAGSSTATRMLAGARLSGPVADRPILDHPSPLYPEWAKREAVEGSVTLHFIVRPDGSIKENVLVEKTAGFDDFDQSAVVALRTWRFQPLPPGRVGEQWGSITFHFRLRDAG
jgi:TonB family protein